MKAIRHILLAAAASGGLALSALGQQASITLRNSDLAFCNAQANTWTVKTLETNINGSDYQQRSSDGGSDLDYVNGLPVTPWGGTHTTVTAGNTIQWDVTVNRVLGAKTITVLGFVAVQNTGSAPATIGNIVVNLQKQKTVSKKTYWISAAANVANAVAGDAATTANIVASGSQEDAAINLANGPANYSVSGEKGTFIETAGSGTLEFTDADSNSIFAMTPQPTIAVGQVVRLLFKATFNNGVLNIPDNTSLRTEVIVTFGNAGLRGGGGSTGKNIDVNGDGVVDNTNVVQVGEVGASDSDEANVRSVPTRITKTLPPMEVCNNVMTLTPVLAAVGTGNNSYTLDNFSTTFAGGLSGSVTVSGTAGGLFPPLAPNYISAPVVVAPSITVNATTGTFPLTGSFTGTVGTVDGAVGIAGAAALSGGIGDSITVNVPSYDSSGNVITDLLGAIIYEPYTIECCPSFADLLAVAWPTYEAPVIITKKYFTYSQGGYQGNGVPGQIFLTNFSTVYSGGLTIGLEDGSGPLHDATWTSSGGTALRTFLAGGGPSGALTADTSNATSVDGGALSKQTAALTLNIGFNDANLLGSTLSNFGDLTLFGFGNALDGMTIRQVLADANKALGTPQTYTPPASGHGQGTWSGGWLPSYAGSYSDLQSIVEKLVVSFDGGVASAFAIAHINY